MPPAKASAKGKNAIETDTESTEELPETDGFEADDILGTLVAMAEQLNAGNGDSLRTIALMALAVANSTTLDALSDEQRAIVAHFKNPAMPSVAATADAAGINITKYKMMAFVTSAAHLALTSSDLPG